jgi:PEGA domain
MRYPNIRASRSSRRVRFLGCLAVALAFTTFYASIADARRRRKKRRRDKISKYVIPKGSATHALKPLEAIGLGKNRVRQITTGLHATLSKVPGVKVAPLENIRRFLKSRHGATYVACEGELSCVVKFGELIKAPLVVAGDLSGLGKGFVLFLRLVDPKAGKVLRKVSVVYGGRLKPEVLLREAAYRLLAPERFRGTLMLKVDVPGAAVYLNGKPMGKSPVKALGVSAGTHALRITHPQYHDYMRFVRVSFEKTTKMKVSLKQFPIISEEMKHKGHKRAGSVDVQPGQQVLYRPLPWYKRWWFITSVGVTVLAATLTTVALSRQRHLDRDGTVTLSLGLRSPPPLPVIRFGR